MLVVFGVSEKLSEQFHHRSILDTFKSNSILFNVHIPYPSEHIYDTYSSHYFQETL